MLEHLLTMIGIQQNEMLPKHISPKFSNNPLSFPLLHFCVTLLIRSFFIRSLKPSSFHAETMILPMQEHLDLLQAKTRLHLRTEGQTAFIIRQCKPVTAKPRKRDSAPKTPERRNNQWASSIYRKKSWM